VVSKEVARSHLPARMHTSGYKKRHKSSKKKEKTKNKNKTKNKKKQKTKKHTIHQTNVSIFLFLILVRCIKDNDPQSCAAILFHLRLLM